MKNLFAVSAYVAALAAAQPTPQSAIIDPAALLHDLQVLSSDDMEGRLVDTPGGAKARAYVIDRFRASGIKPFSASYEQPFSFSSGPGSTTERHGVNVIGHIDGSADLKVRPTYIVVSAHYDHIGVRNGVVFNGADDNASGTAALFAVAKYFSTHAPAHPLIFAAFDGEEEGLRGSRAFVRNPPVDRNAIVIDVNMDMIGRDPDDKLFAVGTRVNPFLKPYLEQVAANAPVKLLLGHDDPAQKNVEDWSSDSDHYAFQEMNVPAVYLGVEDFGQHHKSTDDYETITYSFYVRAVETCIAVVKAFDANLDAIERRDPPAQQLPQFDEKTIDLARPTGMLSGTLLLPRDTTTKVPVVLIIAGSGPTDRDGNSRSLPGKNNAYRLLAEALAADGIASLRYDKQGVGLSSSSLAESDLRFETLVDDAVAWTEKLGADGRFSTITVIGHSEGSLIGILAAQKTIANAFVSIAGVARRASETIRDQIRPQLSAMPDLWQASEAILADLEAGKTSQTTVPGALAPLYRPSVQPYLVSWFKYVPAEEIAKLKIPTLIIQGTTDIQVTTDDAKGLKAAKPDSTLVIVDGMNHVLKEVTDRAKQMSSYSDPSLPVVSAVPKAIVTLVKGLNK